MNKPKYIKYLGVVNSRKYIDLISDRSVFSENNSYNRGNFFADCKSCFIVERYKHKDPELVQKFFDMSHDLMKMLFSSYGHGSILNAQFSLLPAHKNINIHCDSGLPFALSHRVHLPIITNNSAFLHLRDQRYNLKEGQLVEINNSKDHYAENLSDQDRVHLIIDYMPKRFWNYFE